ncbi:MAG: hypothetical protein SGBAC_008485 [Bacillariaceae sp.]
MSSFTKAPLAKIVAVTSENVELKSKLMESRTQCENLEQALRFQTAKATELHEMLLLKKSGDEDAIMGKIVENSLAVAEQTLEIDQLKKKLRDADKEKRSRDQEREAHSEIMAELNRFIREQQIEIQSLQNPSSPSPEVYEYDEVDSEFDKLCNVHEHLKDAKPVIEQKETAAMVEKSREMKLLKQDLKQLRSERAHLIKKVEAQNSAILMLQERSKTREEDNLSFVKLLKEKYEDEKFEWEESQRLLEEEILVLQQNQEQAESERSVLHGEMIEMESQKHEPLLFLSDAKADYEVFEDDSSEITANTFPNSESDNSSPATSLRQMYVSLDDYMDFGTKLEVVDFSTERFEI